MAKQGNFKNFWYGCTGKEVLIDYLLAQEYFCFIEIISHKFSNSHKIKFACSECVRVAQIFLICLTIWENYLLRGYSFIICFNEILRGGRKNFITFFLWCITMGKIICEKLSGFRES